MSALEDRVDADLRLGRHAELIAELGALTAAHPLRERLHGFLMLALYRAGRQGEALRAFQQAREVLADELGLDPGQSCARSRPRSSSRTLRSTSACLRAPATVGGRTDEGLRRSWAESTMWPRWLRSSSAVAW